MANKQTDDNKPLRVLAGDIGGTNTRLAIFDVSGTRLESVAEQSYHSPEQTSLGNIIQHFLDQHPATIEIASFGIAGPVRQDRVGTTNLPWRISAREIAERFSLAKVFLLNDLEANAWGIKALTNNDFLSLRAAVGNPEGNRAIIAAGTGLGEAGLFHDGTGLQPFATEGGHTDFSPTTDLEIALLQYLKKRFRHVSWERILSGPGLAHIHEFLRHHHNSQTPDWLTEEMHAGDPAAVISSAALAQRDAICVATLDLFVHLYGVEAGNLALKTLASGGLYIGGGIAPKIIRLMQNGNFIKAFLAKGRMQPLLEKIPVQIILNDRTALYGPAVYAAFKTGDRSRFKNMGD